MECYQRVIFGKSSFACRCRKPTEESDGRVDYGVANVTDTVE
jgi:hypothetical protein